MRPTILFIKSLALSLPPTEVFAQNVLDDPRYDAHPFVNKDEIARAFGQWGELLNPVNKELYADLTDISVNVEGRFIAQNIPEIESIVIDQSCSSARLVQILDARADITHVGISAYASGMDNTIELIDLLQNQYPQKQVYIGGIGVEYPHIKAKISGENSCTGEGVNFLRRKFGLASLAPQQFRIPAIAGPVSLFPLPCDASYMVSQIGCCNTCDFCITNAFHNYMPFADAQALIAYIEGLYSSATQDVVIYSCDANTFNPLPVWQAVFAHFIKNARRYTRNIFICGASSLSTLKKLPLEQIQRTSPLKILFVNYGIEKTIGAPYAKNAGDPKLTIARLNRLGIITNHSYIIGLPDDTDETIAQEIANNCTYDSDLITVITFKPIPSTSIHRRLASEGRLLFDKIPPEFLYAEGFLPFGHQHLGHGFSILKHAFKAYFETEKSLVHAHGNICNKLLDLYALSGSEMIYSIADTFKNLNEMNFPSFEKRMGAALALKYSENIRGIAQRVSGES
jgi:hypothetical protein